MNKDFILFDLDGTLTDPKKGITRSVDFSLRHFGIETEDLDSLTAFIGPPLKESYKKYYDFSDGQAEVAIEKYREYFSRQGIFENVIYSGIAELLEELVSSGKKLVLATSKPTVYAEKILVYFDIDKYFIFVAGSELSGHRVEKGQVIEYALEKAGIADRIKAVMIGDRKHDILGAKKNSLSSIGVLYGYGGIEELSAADYVVKDVSELRRILLG